MSITKVLSNNDMSAEDKLNRVAEVVSVAREAYGNEEENIGSPMVDTTNGSMSFVHLDDDTKVVCLKSEVARLKSKAVEACNNVPGSNLNKKIEELLATNGMFVNISAGTKFEYI